MNWTPDSVLALTKHKQSRPLWLDLLLHSIINFVRKQSLNFCQYQVSCVESSFDQLTKPTGLTGVLVDLRSRKFSSMTSKLVQSCHSTLSSNRIIYQRLLSKIMGASSQYRANLEGKFTVDSRPTDTSPLQREPQWNASRNDWIQTSVFTTDSSYYWGADTFMPPSETFYSSFLPLQGKPQYFV